MRFIKSVFRRNDLAFGIVLGLVVQLGFVPCRLDAVETPAASKSDSGAFVSYNDETLTLKGKSGLIVYENIGQIYKSYHNNESGPGSRLVNTVDALSGSVLPGNVPALSRVLPGTLVRVNVEAREIYFGLDYRVVGTLVSYQDDKLVLLAADVEPGLVKIPTGKISLTIAPKIPGLESVGGGDFKYAGSAGELLKNAKPGAKVTARSEYDVDAIEVIEVGEPRRRMERYIGQTRGPERGTFVSFKDGLLRIHGKGVRSLAVNDYERLTVRRIDVGMPVFESIDGGEYQPVGVDALKSVKEGTIVTIQKVENVVLAVQIGMVK